MKKKLSIFSWAVLFSIVLMGTDLHAEEGTESQAEAVSSSEVASEASTDTESTGPVVDVSVEEGVTVNTGSDVVDDSVNLVAKCAEKKAAMDACPGGFKGIACRKALELGRYKGVECPDI
jgi:hypothetical protein